MLRKALNRAEPHSADESDSSESCGHCLTRILILGLAKVPTSVRYAGDGSEVPMTRPTVYVSYHDDDRAVVARLKKALQQSGLTVFDRQSRDMHWLRRSRVATSFLLAARRGR
jgi:hypothetical protein